MPVITLIYGLLLVLVGIVGYSSSGGASVTALIPAFFGAPQMLCGFLARTERFRKHAMHVAAMLALLATLGTLRGLLSLPTLLSGGEVARPAAVYSQSIVAVLSIVFLVLCIRSFIAARKAREAAAG